MHSHRIAFVIFDGFQSLDLVGPHEVFQRAGGYDCSVVAPGQGRSTPRAGCRCTPGSG
ncbi:hypothetical protein ACFQ0B_53885 [Nonomuraea thailandensis]